MGDSHTSESEDGMLSTDSDYNFSGNSQGGVVLKKGPWTSAEDAILIDYVKSHGEGNWNAVQKHSGLARCGKSCRLRWANHLRPNLKKGAFTSEEERLIIELHAKMGNKWARMAAHLPGRTDNEIKNYWNTRIKRRHRAGLPLYPPEICAEVRPENEQQLTTGGLYVEDKGFHDILQTNGYKTPNAMFACFNILPYTPEFLDTPANGLMVNGFGCPQFHNFVPNTIGLEKHSLDPDELMSDYGGEYLGDSANEVSLCERNHVDTCENKMSQSFSPCIPLDPEHTRKLFPFGVSQDSHFMSDAHISASEHFAGAQKLELPSFQYQDTSLCVLDSAPKLLDYSVQYPLSGSPTSHRPSRQNSGLLEDLIYEAEALSKMENQSSDMTDRSAWKPCSTVYKGFLDSISPSNSIEYMFDGCTSSGTVGRLSEEKIPVLHVKSEVLDASYILESERKENLNHLDFSRPDALLGSSWVQKRGPVNDAIAALLGYDSGTEFKNTSASASSRSLSSCSWNNMPAVYQMSEPPRTFPK